MTAHLTASGAQASSARPVPSDERSSPGSLRWIRHALASGVRELRERPKGQVPVLDALRSAAVLLVVVGHFASDVANDPRVSGPQSIFNHRAFTFGWTGVDLFFILSGYLIGRQLWREFVGTGTVDVRRFVLRRGFRIWPLYALFVVVSASVPPRRFSWSDVLFVSNYVPGRVAGGWSLSTEEQFYIFVPIAVYLLRRLGARVWVALLPVLVGAVLVARVVTARGLFAHGYSAADVKTVMYFPFHLRSEALFVGLLIALVSVLQPQWFARARNAGFSWAGFAVAVAALVVGGGLRGISNVIFPFFGLALIFGGVTTWLLVDRSWVSQLLSGRVFYVISRLSYGTYLNHLYIMWFILPWILRPAVAALGPSTGAAALGLTLLILLSLAAAATSFILVEQPFLLLRAHFMRPRAQSLVATPGAAAAAARDVVGAG